MRSHVSNFGIEKDTSKPINLVWLWIGSPHDELAGHNDADFRSATLGGGVVNAF